MNENPDKRTTVGIRQYLVPVTRFPDAVSCSQLSGDMIDWGTHEHDNGDVAPDDFTGMVGGNRHSSLEPRAGGYKIDTWVDAVQQTSAKRAEDGETLSGNQMPM
jgi:hypothetical protein